MAVKILKIDGKSDVVVASANYVPATGIVGLEASGNIAAIVEDDKLILSGKDVDFSNYYTKNETYNVSC